MTLLIVVLLIMLFFLLLITGVSFYAYRETFYVNKKKKFDISKLENGIITDDELEKINSLLETVCGRNPNSFCVPLPIPLPDNPPDPTEFIA